VKRWTHGADQPKSACRNQALEATESEQGAAAAGALAGAASQLVRDWRKRNSKKLAAYRMHNKEG